MPAAHSLQPWTYHCLLGLLAVAGLRISESRLSSLMRRQLADPDLRCVLTHQLPHRALGQRVLAHSAVRQHAAEDGAFLYPCHVQPSEARASDQYSAAPVGDALKRCETLRDAQTSGGETPPDHPRDG